MDNIDTIIFPIKKYCIVQMYKYSQLLSVCGYTRVSFMSKTIHTLYCSSTAVAKTKCFVTCY